MKKEISKVIDRMINIGAGALDESCPISIIDINKWEWAQGVGLYGMYRYYEVSGINLFLILCFLGTIREFPRDFRRSA
jgi:rhamnogalacturonyl hydrolase YesR